jgi:hypothetical protein
MYSPSNWELFRFSMKLPITIEAESLSTLQQESYTLSLNYFNATQIPAPYFPNIHFNVILQSTILPYVTVNYDLIDDCLSNSTT